jgi:dTDP-glucose 4,6-dehydratase
VPVKIARPFNTYGPRQSARAVIPTIICQLLTGNNRLELGNLDPTRDLTFVKDTCKGFISIHQSSDDLIGQIANIGMNKEISVGDLAHKIARIMNKSIEILSDGKRLRPCGSEVERLRCDNSKLMRHTSWKPDYTLESGLKETINWLESNIHFYKSEQYNV